MTPIPDHAHHLRQRLIKDPRSAAKLHYQALIAKGLREDDAANMSGWHPMLPWDTFFGRATVAITIMVVTFLLIVLTNTANATMGIPDLQRSENALINCMNGEAIRFDNGERWACIRLEDRR